MAAPSPLERAGEYRREALAALAAGDWHAAHGWAKGWISSGGARSVEPWLVYVASALLHGQPRTAVRACDLALGNWLQDEKARAVVLYVRAQVIRGHLRDPKSARADLAAAAAHAPAWLRAQVSAASAACGREAAASRRRTPAVGAAPAYDDRPREFVDATPAELTSVDAVPGVWAAVSDVLTAAG